MNDSRRSRLVLLGSGLELSVSKLLLGVNLVVGKMVTRDFPILFASGITLAAASLILLVLLLLAEGRVRLPGRRDLLILLLQSFLGIFAFRILMLYGLKLSTATSGGIIFSTGPAMLAALSVLFLRERLGPARALAVALAVAGVLLINLGGSDGGGAGTAPVLGNLLLLGAVFGDAMFSIFRRMTAERISPLAQSLAVTFFGLLMFLPFTVAEGLAMDFSGIAAAGWLLLFYFGTIAPILSFVLWFDGLSRIQAVTAAAFTALVPVGTLALSSLVLHEPLLPAHLGGAAAVLAAVLLSTLGVRRRAGPRGR